jgi:hypothetical protein
MRRLLRPPTRAYRGLLGSALAPSMPRRRRSGIPAGGLAQVAGWRCGRVGQREADHRHHSIGSGGARPAQEGDRRLARRHHAWAAAHSVAGQAADRGPRRARRLRRGAPECATGHPSPCCAVALATSSSIPAIRPASARRHAPTMTLRRDASAAAPADARLSRAPRLGARAFHASSGVGIPRRARRTRRICDVIGAGVLQGRGRLRLCVCGRSIPDVAPRATVLQAAHRRLTGRGSLHEWSHVIDLEAPFVAQRSLLWNRRRRAAFREPWRVINHLRRAT